MIKERLFCGEFEVVLANLADIPRGDGPFP